MFVVRKPSAVAVILFVSVSVGTGCVYDRTGQSRTAQLYYQIDSHTERIGETERKAATLDARIERLRKEEEAYRERVADAGANLDGLLEALTALRGEVGELREEVRNRSALDEEVDYRLVAIEGRVDKLERTIIEGFERLAAGDVDFELPTNPPATGGLPTARVESDGGSDSGGAKVDEGSGTPTASDHKSDDVSQSNPTEGGAGEDTPVAEVSEGVQGSPDDIAFANALEAYRDGQWSKAGRALAGFTRKYPESPHAPEAAYLRGDTLYQQANYNGAIAAFQVVIESWGTAGQAPRAMYMQGVCFEAMGDPQDAAIFYQEVARIYPDSPEAADALARIKEIAE